MIAVFTRHFRDYDDMKCMPAKNFVRISKLTDVVGTRFDSVITVRGFWENKDVKEAYDWLYEHQFELFTLRK